MEALVDSGSKATLMSDRLWMRERDKKLEGSPSLVGVDGSDAGSTRAMRRNNPTRENPSN